ncbi:MAG: hypothetical protein IPK19_07630 [Chloroflexi bacterium]|nr:hypothetical protein [Chloroflexota bacterium]
MKKSGLADSPFFQTSLPQSGKGREVFNASPSERKNERLHDGANVRTENRSETQMFNLPPKRMTKRYRFEFYEDQIVQLKQLRAHAALEGVTSTFHRSCATHLILFLNRTDNPVRTKNRTENRSLFRTIERWNEVPFVRASARKKRDLTIHFQCA